MAASKDPDDEVTLQLPPMKYNEVPGKRGGVLYHTEDDHLYRFVYIPNYKMKTSFHQ